MKRMIALVLVLGLILGLCACGGDKVKQTEGSPVDEVVEDPTDEGVKKPTEEDADASDEETTELPAGTLYTVNVVDEGGNPLVGVQVQICQGELCILPSTTDDSGVVTFTVSEAGAYEAKLLSLPEGYEYATEEQMFPFGNAFELTIILKAVA